MLAISPSMDIGFIAPRPSLVDAAFLGDLLVRLPVERVPVPNDHLALRSLSSMWDGTTRNAS